MLRTKVLIIGAGPTGLMGACQLERYGVDYIIIDKKEGPTRESRALVVHARSLEIYEQLGIADEAMLQGQVVKKVQFLFGKQKIQEFPLGSIGEGLSYFPFLLVLEQSKNETLLSEYIARQEGDVLWNTEMVALQQDEGKVIVQVKGKEGSYAIQADYLIAADGGRSSVRHALEIPFKGDTYERIFYVADTAVSWKGSHEALSIYLFRQTFMALFPMQGENRFRVIGILPSSYQDEHPKHFEEIIPLIQKQLDLPLTFSDTRWFSVYRLHHRCLEHFRKDRIFFAGDAAHIHSPAGGQGMNTGLQDAYNLAWKLAYVVKGRAGEKLLNTYEQERLPFARQLIRTTDRAFSFVTSHKWHHRFLRMGIVPFLLPLFFRVKQFRLRSFRTVSQIGIRYINSDLTINRVREALKIKAGERFPFLTNGRQDSVYSLMNKPLFYALLFAPDSKSKFFDEAAALENEFHKMVAVLDLSNEKHLIAALGIKREVIILVRPDHYIGLITDEGIKVVRDYLKNIVANDEAAADDGTIT